MPTTPEDSTRKEVLYPDELQGESFFCRDVGGFGGDLPLVFDADDEEDDQVLPDDARHGYFIPVEKLYEDWQGWVSAPGAFRVALVDEGIKTGEGFHVKRCDRDGNGTTPYEVVIERAEE